MWCGVVRFVSEVKREEGMMIMVCECVCLLWTLLREEGEAQKSKAGMGMILTWAKEEKGLCGIYKEVRGVCVN